MCAMAPQSPAGLKGLPLFEGVPEVSLSLHGLRAAPRSLKAGEDLFLSGDPRTHAWFVRSGWLRIRVHSPAGHESTVEVLGPGEMCGAAGCFGRATYPHGATALTDATAVGVATAAFERWVHGDARASWRMADILGRRLLDTMLLRAINAEQAPVRLRLTLSWLSRKFGPRIPATRSLLADLTGLRAETCSRALSEMRRRGIIRVSPGLIQILRADELGPVPV